MSVINPLTVHKALQRFAKESAASAAPTARAVGSMLANVEGSRQIEHRTLTWQRAIATVDSRPPRVYAGDSL